MSTNLSPIYPFELPVAACEVAGSVGRFELVEISRLRIDETYQREISGTSARNIRRIAKTFDWRRFTPVIAVSLGDETYAIIDGQHRTTAARTREIERVPAYIIDATVAEAAAAFAAINTDITRMSALDIYRAKLAAGDRDARELEDVCAAAEVKLTTRQKSYTAGETPAVSVLQRALKRYGGELLTLILQCITQTRDGNAGLIIGATVNGIGQALQTKPSLYAKPGELFDLFDQIDLAEVLHRAKIEAVRTLNPAQYIITREINTAIRTWQRREAA